MSLIFGFVMGLFALGAFGAIAHHRGVVELPENTDTEGA